VGGVGGLAGGAPRPPPLTPAQSSEFAKRAAKIGAGIHSTSNKLARLAQLAKRTSMFDDPAHEINELTDVIKQDISRLNGALVELQQVSVGAGASNKQSSAHSTTVVNSLRQRLQTATQEFKGVLTTRTDNLKANEERRSLFTDAKGAAGGAGPSDPLLPGSSLGLSSGPAGLGLGAPGAPAGLGLGLGSQLEQQQISAPQDTYMASRTEALKNVEKTILELGGIFEQLSHMVQAQGEVAVRIDEDVEAALTNVEGAQGQLLKYLETISSNRALVMKIFGILAFFAVLFVVFLV